MLQLRDYQRDAIDALYRYWGDGGGNGLIVLPTGAGKALVIAKLIEELLADYPDMRIANITHSKTLVEQNFKEFIGLCPFAPAGIYSAGLGRKDARAQILFGGIQSIYNKAATIGEFDLVLVDEAHAISRNSDSQYGAFLADVKTINPDSRVCGLTATDYRLDSGRLTEGDDRLFDDVVYEIGIGELIEQGYLSPLSSKTGGIVIDTAGVGRRGGEFIAGELERAADKDEITTAAVAEAIARGHDRRAALFFCSGQDHSEHVRDEIRRQGRTAESLTSRVTPAEQRRIQEDFKSGKAWALCSANMLTTGFNVPHVDLISMLRPTSSTGLFVQMCLDEKTEILTDSGWKGPDTIAANDNVAGYDIANGSAKWQPIIDIIDRPLMNGEIMVGVDSPHMDIRVTDGHNLVVACRSSRIRREVAPKWKIESAGVTMRRRDNIYIPVAANMDAPGVDLTDAEIAFLGWFLSDGTLSRTSNAVSISQSVTSPQIDHIRATLDACGFRYGVHIVDRDNGYSGLARFSISFGDARILNGTGTRGWNRLSNYINADKKISDSYSDMTRDQLLVLLDALNRGDGAKYVNKGWTRQTYAITFGIHRHTIDRIQELCVLRGVRANISDKQMSNLFLRACPNKDRSVIGGTRRDIDGRSSIIERGTSQGERVWCVETPMGTIITRRNGKVAIMGNCGRGTRLSPGKTDCLVLDHSGNLARHGPIDMVRPKTPGKGQGEAPIKICPQCEEILLISRMVCTCCGYEFPPNEEEKITAKPDTAPVLSTEKPWVQVYTRTFWHHPGKDGKPDTVKVSYRVGMKSINQWLCPGHPVGGFAKVQADKYWMQHGGARPFPASVLEWLGREGELAETREIQLNYARNPKYPDVAAFRVGDAPAVGKAVAAADYMAERAPGWAPTWASDMDDEIPF